MRFPALTPGHQKPPPGTPIDLAHPRARDLRLLVPFWERSNQNVNALKPAGVVFTQQGATTADFRPTRGGGGLYIAGGGDRVVASPYPGLPTPDGITVKLVATFDTGSSFYGKAVSWGADASWTLGIDAGGNDRATFRTWTGAGERTASGGVEITDGLRHVIHGTYDGYTSWIAVDGVVVATNGPSSFSALLSPSSTNVAIGNDPGGANSAPGVYEWLEVYGRAFTAREIAEDAARPFDIMAAPALWLGAIPTGGGPPPPTTKNYYTGGLGADRRLHRGLRIA